MRGGGGRERGWRGEGRGAHRKKSQEGNEGGMLRAGSVWRMRVLGRGCVRSVC